MPKIGDLSREELENVAKNFTLLSYFHFKDLVGNTLAIIATTAPESVVLHYAEALKYQVHGGLIDNLIDMLEDGQYYATSLTVGNINCMRA